MSVSNTIPASSSSIELMKTSKPWKAPTIKTEGSTDELYEMENHFILRLPEDAAERVIGLLKEEHGDRVKESLSIKFDTDLRNVTVKLDKQFFHGKLMDLPCIVECLKTLDKKTFYKVANVSQIAIVQSENDPKPVEEKEEPENPKKKEKMYQYPHGLTPPLKNVRKRRFRKTLKKKNLDAPELDRELKRLLRADMEAMRIKWEVVEEEEIEAPKDGEKSDSDATPAKTKTRVLLTGSSEDARAKKAAASSKPREFCFSQDSLGDQKPAEDSLGDDSLQFAPNESTTILSIPEEEISMSALGEEDESDMPTFKIPALNRVENEAVAVESPKKTTKPKPQAKPESPADTNQFLINEVEKALSDLVKKRINLEKELKLLDNAFLKEQMQSDLDKLIAEEKQKIEELELLKG